MKPIFIDTDMGVDDIVAIAMIIASNKFDIQGISVVNGVSSVNRGIDNLNRILTYLGVSCPIYIGANQIQQHSSRQFPFIDRKRANTMELLKGIKLPLQGVNPVLPLKKIKKSSIDVFAIGPLTNIPELLCIIKSLTIMGGNINTKDRFEYNIRLDTKAANEVFSSNIPIQLVPLDATQYVPAKNSIKLFKTIQAKQKTGKIIRKIILNNRNDFNYFYDPLAAALLIDPSIIEAVQHVDLTVQKSGKINSRSNPNGIAVVSKINSKRFYLLMQTLIK